jgi:hypothetical protein
MSKQQAMQIEKAHADVLAGSIADLKVLSEQLSGLDDIKAERQKAQAQLDYARKYLKQTQDQIKENEYFRDKYMAEAREKAAESERLDREIKEKRATAAQLNDWRNKMLQQLQG